MKTMVLILFIFLLFGEPAVAFDGSGAVTIFEQEAGVGIVPRHPPVPKKVKPPPRVEEPYVLIHCTKRLGEWVKVRKSPYQEQDVSFFYTSIPGANEINRLKNLEAGAGKMIKVEYPCTGESSCLPMKGYVVKHPETGKDSGIYVPKIFRVLTLDESGGEWISPPEGQKVEVRCAREKKPKIN